MMWLLMRVPRVVVLPPESNLHLSETSKDAHGPLITYRLVAEREQSPSAQSAKYAEAALAGGGAEAVIEGGDRCAAGLLGGKEHAAVRQLEACPSAERGQADRGGLAQGDGAQLKLSQRGRGSINAANAGRADKDLGQGDGARPQRLAGDGAQQRASILVEDVGLVEVRD